MADKPSDKDLEKIDFSKLERELMTKIDEITGFKDLVLEVEIKKLIMDSVPYQEIISLDKDNPIYKKTIRLVKDIVHYSAEKRRDYFRNR